jgi:hypothetical protein
MIGLLEMLFISQIEVMYLIIKSSNKQFTFLEVKKWGNGMLSLEFA